MGVKYDVLGFCVPGIAEIDFDADKEWVGNPLHIFSDNPNKNDSKMYKEYCNMLFLKKIKESVIGAGMYWKNPFGENPCQPKHKGYCEDYCQGSCWDDKEYTYDE